MFPFEHRELIEKKNRELQYQDQIVPILLQTTTNTEYVGDKKVGRRVTTNNKIVVIEFRLDKNGQSLENDPRSHR